MSGTDMLHLFFEKPASSSNLLLSLPDLDRARHRRDFPSECRLLIPVQDARAKAMEREADWLASRRFPAGHGYVM